MILHIDPSAATPPYEQLRSQIAVMIGAGMLTPGERLPLIRQLAGDLGLAAGAIARAYGELERQGLVRGRQGTLVLDPPGPVPAADQETHLTEAARTFALRAHQLGVDPDRALQYAHQAFTALNT